MSHTGHLERYMCIGRAVLTLQDGRPTTEVWERLSPTYAQHEERDGRPPGHNRRLLPLPQMPTNQGGGATPIVNIGQPLNRVP